MSNEPHQIEVSGLLVEVVRKRIKNLHLRVYPPAGRVRVSAPLHVSDEAVRVAVINHLPWIERQQAKLGGLERQSGPEFVSGESHYFQGRLYSLNVVCQRGPENVVIRKETIDLYVRDPNDMARRERVFLKWYRQQLKALVPPLITKWESIIGEKVDDWGVKQMKTRWGTCNIKARRIWLSLELIKKPVHCLEYVIAHEIVHLLERRHNDRFAALMDRFMPQWRLHRDELNRSALRYETWKN